MAERLITANRSIIPALDIDDADQLERIVKATGEVSGVGAYKVGFELGLTFGLLRVVDKIRTDSAKPIIYDHQKAGTDIPETGRNFARTVARSGVEAVIFFPHSGTATLEAWVKASQDAGLRVLIGSHMSHEKFLASEGGYIENDAPRRVFEQAAGSLGVRDFVVPGNKLEALRSYRELFDDTLGAGNYDLYAPGFINQGGNITEAGKIAGDNFHGIVGRALTSLTTVEEIRAAIEQMTGQIR